MPYNVKEGDSLSGIASQHSISVNELVGWNNLIQVGQVLTIVDPAPEPEPEPEPVDPEPAHNYTRVTYGGRTVNQRTKDMLNHAASIVVGVPVPFDLTQGSYNTGVGASAGTHDGGGVVDISVVNDNLSTTQRNNLLFALRKAGFAAWLRSPSEGFAYHIHAVAIGDREMSPPARDQIVDYFEGRNGLANNGPDSAPASVGRPYPEWAAKYAPGSTSPPGSGDDPYMNGLPRVNSQNPSAIPLQRQLKRVGYMDKGVAEHPNYGPKTQEAVTFFHNDNPRFKSVGVANDPQIGPQGWTFLKSMKDGSAKTSSPPVSSVRPSSPVPGHSVGSNPYGKKGNYAAGYHTGHDYPAPTGTPVVAVRDGVIAWANSNGGAYGTWLGLRADNGRDYVYCHLSAIKRTAGRHVKAGETIGYVGNTGNSTGPHLHFEDRPAGGGYGNVRKPQW